MTALQEGEVVNRKRLRKQQSFGFVILKMKCPPIIPTRQNSQDAQLDIIVALRYQVPNKNLGTIFCCFPKYSNKKALSDEADQSLLLLLLLLGTITVSKCPVSSLSSTF